MYKKHFGLKDKPFNLTPDPAYLYLSGSCNNALEHFSSLISGKNRLVVFTGAIGSGKTVLLRSFVKKVSAETELIHFNYAGDDRSQFLQVALHAFGAGEVDSAAADLGCLRDEFKKLLAGKIREDGCLVCVIDEAQNLGKSALDEAWRMLDVEIDDRRPVRMLLAGLPKLQERVKSLKRKDSADNGIVSYHLELLSGNEVAEYIRHRLSVAGFQGASVFSDDGVKDIARVSEGTPRLINIICDSALLNAYFMEERSVTPEILKEVFQDLFYKSGLMDRSISSSSIELLSSGIKSAKNVVADPADLHALRQGDGGIVTKAYYREVTTGSDTETAEPERPDQVAGTSEKTGVQLLDRIIDFADSLTGLGVSRDAAMDAFRDYVGADKPGERSIELDSDDLPLSVLLLEKNARMKMHLENKFHEVGFNPIVLTSSGDLFEVLNSADPLEIQVLVADAGYFIEDGKNNNFEGWDELKRIRADYAYLPLLITSVMPLTTVRANFIQVGIPFLLHKPDLGRMDLSMVRREFGRFFQELYGSVIGIHSMFNAFYRRVSGV